MGARERTGMKASAPRTKSGPGEPGPYKRQSPYRVRRQDGGVTLRCAQSKKPALRVAWSSSARSTDRPLERERKLAGPFGRTQGGEELL